MAAAGAHTRIPYLNDRESAKAPHRREDLMTYERPKCGICGSPLGDFGQCTNGENRVANGLPHANV